MPEIKIPTLSGAGIKLWIGRWFKRVGDPVTVHEPPVEIDDVTHEIRTPATGLLSRILARDGEVVEPDTVLGTIDTV